MIIKCLQCIFHMKCTAMETTTTINDKESVFNQIRNDYVENVQYEIQRD